MRCRTPSMLPPDAARRMQAEIDAALKAAEADPGQKALADEAVAEAKAAADRMLAARMAGSGYVGALYGELRKRGLIKS